MAAAARKKFMDLENRGKRAHFPYPVQCDYPFINSKDGRTYVPKRIVEASLHRSGVSPVGHENPMMVTEKIVHHDVHSCAQYMAEEEATRTQLEQESRRGRGVAQMRRDYEAGLGRSTVVRHEPERYHASKGVRRMAQAYEDMLRARQAKDVILTRGPRRGRGRRGKVLGDMVQDYEDRVQLLAHHPDIALTGRRDPGPVVREMVSEYEECLELLARKPGHPYFEGKPYPGPKVREMVSEYEECLELLARKPGHPHFHGKPYPGPMVGKMRADYDAMLAGRGRHSGYRSPASRMPRHTVGGMVRAYDDMVTGRGRHSGYRSPASRMPRHTVGGMVRAYDDMITRHGRGPEGRMPVQVVEEIDLDHDELQEEEEHLEMEKSMIDEEEEEEEVELELEKELEMTKIEEEETKRKMEYHEAKQEELAEKKQEIEAEEHEEKLHNFAEMKEGIIEEEFKHGVKAAQAKAELEKLKAEEEMEEHLRRKWYDPKVHVPQHLLYTPRNVAEKREDMDALVRSIGRDAARNRRRRTVRRSLR